MQESCQLGNEGGFSFSPVPLLGSHRGGRGGGPTDLKFLYTAPFWCKTDPKIFFCKNTTTLLGFTLKIMLGLLGLNVLF